MKQITRLLLVLTLFLLLEISCSSPSKRPTYEFTLKDGTPVRCVEPPPDVIATGVNVNAEVAARKIGTILKGTGGIGVDIERIRQELPSDVSAFDLVEFKICIQYGNQVLSKEEYRSFTDRILPAIKKGTSAVSNEWHRLTDSDRTQMSLILGSTGSLYKIDIFRTPTRDCIDLADDFYDLLTQMEWRVSKPRTPWDYELEPGIRVRAMPDNNSSAPIKNVMEASGARLLVEALEKIKLPVLYQARGGTLGDLTIHLEIGIKRERSL